MPQSPSIEKAMTIATKAFERIGSESLFPTPENYELWYVYYAELNPELNHAIELLAGEQDITDEQCLRLYNEYLSETARNDRVQKAGDKIQETLQSVGGVVSSVRDATSRYNETLGSVSEKLSDDIDVDTMRSVMDEVVSNTQQIMDENQKLEAKLTQSSEVMYELKRDLEIMRQEAQTDGLTSLLNRKAFDVEFERIASEAMENDEVFCFIMMDIDHFKQFNDDYGHQVGDQVLRLVAKTLFDGVKGRDVVARYGGEEFAVILPETSIEGGRKLADALRMAVANKELINRSAGTNLGRVTLSGGIAEFEKGEDMECLIARADNALYAAKKKGRNKIVNAAPSSDS